MARLADLAIPIWGESRAGLEHATLLGDPVLRGAGIPHGDGAPVMLVPGFLAGDTSLRLMARWLRRIGYRPCRAGIRANVDCTSRALERLEGQLERFADQHGRQVTVVGHSRGGSMARVLAVRRPDLIEGIVSLGSPMVDQLAVHPLVRLNVHAVAALGALGVPGAFTYGCFYGGCCEVAREEIAGPFPENVRFVSVYSRTDGIVDWHACLDPAAEHVEVRSSHIGMAFNANVYRVIADALAPRGREPRALAA